LIRIKDYSSTTYVTGMRAFAAMAVLLIHSGGGGLRSLGALGGGLVDLGRGGVYAFFVISGFSVASSYGHAGGYGRYLFQRFMRLAPLYYFWLLVYGIVLRRSGQWSVTLGVPAWPLDIFLHLAFLNAFYLQSANSFIGLEWSLSVEMFWYLLLPGLLWLVRRGHGLALITTSLIFYFIIHVLFGKRAETEGAIKLALYWHPFVYLLSYALGVLAFVIRDQVRPGERLGGVLFALALLLAYACAPLWQPYVQLDMVLVVSLASFLLLVYGSNDNGVCRWLFMSKPVLVLGTLSYGIYLSHLLMIYYLSDILAPGPWETLCVTALSVAAAWIGYTLIEQPSQRWAKRFIRL
jgi:peptidoglycan/LPS O-acetylase OafA/YrhL